ncbi:MAG: glycosyltransferase family 4 protein, partial [Saprospiraceae bacterium]
MKIVLLSPAHPLRGGIAASSERLAQALQSQGHEVVIYSFSLQYPGFLFPGKTQYTDDPPPTDLQIKTELNSIQPFNWIAVGRAIAREHPDRVLVRFWLPFMGPALGTVLRVMQWSAKRKVKVTALVDNIIPHEKRPGDRLFARYFVQACDDFVVMSRSVGEEIRGFSASKPVRYAPHPIYDNYGEPMDADEARRQLGIPANVPLL